MIQVVIGGLSDVRLNSLGAQRRKLISVETRPFRPRLVGPDDWFEEGDNHEDDGVDQTREVVRWEWVYLVENLEQLLALAARFAVLSIRQHYLCPVNSTEPLWWVLLSEAYEDEDS